MRKRRCWYCKRVGRFGWKKGRPPCVSPECKNDEKCFARARYRSLVRELREASTCPDCYNAQKDGPGIVPSYTAAGWNGRGPDGDPCDSDYHPENGFVL